MQSLTQESQILEFSVPIQGKRIANGKNNHQIRKLDPEQSYASLTPGQTRVILRQSKLNFSSTERIKGGKMDQSVQFEINLVENSSSEEGAQP